ncbi:UNVERIFIED_CONTAM: hypothetical protein Slati_3137400 [Sesamum latifolium]|uniref:CCHC-type domain-containing protein n=1 Tax=Sesamum latifolium TaxID=2727402 RepID=A0AAW2UW50_9LAMI
MGQHARAVVEEMSVLTDVIDLRIDGMLADLNLLKRAVGREEDRTPVSKVKVLDPKAFGGERSAKELENFLWDMETYFQAAKLPDAEKVSITSMYLTGDVKLWWLSRLSDDANADREHTETWDVLKKKLKNQFLPCNTSWVARESLQNMRHTGTIRKFVKELCSLLLNVRDMLEEDKLFNFMRQDDSRKGKTKFGKKFKRKEKAKEVVTETSEPRAVEIPRGGCFICGNLEHRARDCPKRDKLNAIVAEQTYGDSETEQTRVGALQLSVLQA